MRKGNVMIVAIHEDDLPVGFQWPEPSLAFGVTHKVLEDDSWKGAIAANVIQCVRMLVEGISGRLGLEPSHPVVDAIAAMRTGAPYIGAEH